jgi:hypothetical protein
VLVGNAVGGEVHIRQLPSRGFVVMGWCVTL